MKIKKDPKYAESNISIIGITRNLYGRPQYFLVNADQGRSDKLKFPGLRFQASNSKGNTLEDMAKYRFEEQTGYSIDTMLGLRAIIPARSRHSTNWTFQNVFLGVVNDLTKRNNDGRSVYVSEPGQGIINDNECVIEAGNVNFSRKLVWANQNDRIVARVAKDILYHFDWERQDTEYLRRIPCLGASTKSDNDSELGCSLAVSSMMLLYQESPDSQQKIILIKRKGDDYPGYGGGKIETPISMESKNLDPISGCAMEGSEEYGFDIQPRALLGVAITPLECSDDSYYNAIMNYAFVAEPTNLLHVREALKNPKDHLERKMECYVVETLDEHRDRILRKELRMPDMVEIGNQFYKRSPGEKIPLTQFLSSGSY